MTHTTVPRAAIILVAAAALSACSFTSPGSASFRQRNFYSYVEQQGQPQGGSPSNVALVVGSVNFTDSMYAAAMRQGRIASRIMLGMGGDVIEARSNGLGGVFAVERLDAQGRPQERVNLALTKHGTRIFLSPLLPRRTFTRNAETQQVFAGQVPANRRSHFPEWQPGIMTLVAALYGYGDGMKRANAYHVQVPSGWFVIALPPGRYRMVDLQSDFTKLGGGCGRNCTSVHTRTYSVGTGPEFEVQAGRANYVGSHVVSFPRPDQAQFARDDQRQVAERVLAQELRRVGIDPSRWPVAGP